MSDVAQINDQEQDGTMNRVFLGLVVLGVLAGVVAWFGWSLREAVSVWVGALAATANLAAIAYVVAGFLHPERSKLSPLMLSLGYVAKLVALFGGIYLLFRAGWVRPAALMAGFCVLLPAVVLGGLSASAGNAVRADRE